MPSGWHRPSPNTPKPEWLPHRPIMWSQAERCSTFFCALSEIERLILWSHVVDGKSIRTVAREFGLNWHRVAGILDRVLRMARRNLDT